jgi:hypothetical protein
VLSSLKYNNFLKINSLLCIFLSAIFQSVKTVLKLVLYLPGLVYMVLKHFVDRYNIYFAYGPSKISSHIHASAINIVIISITLQQLSFTSLSILRQGFNYISVYSVVGFCITLLFLSAQIFLNWCKGFSPISYQVWLVLHYFGSLNNSGKYVICISSLCKCQWFGVLATDCKVVLITFISRGGAHIYHLSVGTWKSTLHTLWWKLCTAILMTLYHSLHLALGYCCLRLCWLHRTCSRFPFPIVSPVPNCKIRWWATAVGMWCPQWGSTPLSVEGNFSFIYEN